MEIGYILYTLIAIRKYPHQGYSSVQLNGVCFRWVHWIFVSMDSMGSSIEKENIFIFM